VGTELVFQPPLLRHPGPSIFLVISGVFCALFAFPVTDKSGMPNAHIAIGLREKNSRAERKKCEEEKVRYSARKESLI
jgi:hypothetical protein